MLDKMLENFIRYKNRNAIIIGRYTMTYEELTNEIDAWFTILDEKLEPGTVVALQGDFTPTTISLFFALLKKQAIVVPLARETINQELDQMLLIAQAQKLFYVGPDESIEQGSLPGTKDNPLLLELAKQQEPGLICFTSGSSGTPKATLHNFNRLLTKYTSNRPGKVTVNFLLFDHLGGLNTMLHILSTGGTLIGLEQRTPDYVCNIMQKHGVQILPTSPTFLNMLILSEAYKAFNLTTIELITYGAEPMPKTTLNRLIEIFPNTSFLQTYGLIETGVLSKRSKAPDSLWIQLGVKSKEWRVVDGILQIKSNRTMLGYLNAPSPITEDGWFITGDQVEEDGDYIKILGRASELINIGGEKVFPVEIENVILTMENVKEVTVFAVPHTIMGKMICANVRLMMPEPQATFKKSLKKYCLERLAPFKVPSKIIISEEQQSNRRMKKDRYNVTQRAQGSGIL